MGSVLEYLWLPNLGECDPEPISVILPAMADWRSERAKRVKLYNSLHPRRPARLANFLFILPENN